jgi:hypothetical protein
VVGIIEIETISPPTVPPPLDVTVTFTLPETGPANPCAVAVIDTVPAPTAVTSPEELTDATPGMAEDHVTWLVII